MQTLREWLSITISKNNSAIMKPFSLVKITKLANEIEQRYGAPAVSLKEDELKQLYNAFCHAIELNDWTLISDKFWKRVCWIMWNGDNQLASNKLFMNNFIKYCNDNITPRMIRSLIYVYLRDYKKRMPGMCEMLPLIKSSFSDYRIKERLAIWSERDSVFHLFDEKKDFTRDAWDYFNHTITAREYLASIGLEQQLESGNYSQELYKAIAALFSKEINRTTFQARMLERFLDVSINNNNELRYPQIKFSLIESLLLPWIKKNPPSEITKRIMDFLRDMFQDPRTSQGRLQWVGVSDESLRVIRKWLAGATLEQFFDIIDTTAQDDHWKYRRAFWNAYYEDGHIDDAWIALGKDSRLEVSSLSVSGNELIAANIRGSGVKPDHSVLIFKVGDLTICEWSHVGKCRIWKSKNKKTPKLYQVEYQAEYLRENDDYSIAHHSSENYHWQEKLSDYVYKCSGIKVPRYKFKV